MPLSSKNVPNHVELSSLKIIAFKINDNPIPIINVGNQNWFNSNLTNGTYACTNNRIMYVTTSIKFKIAYNVNLFKFYLTF